MLYYQANLKSQALDTTSIYFLFMHTAGLSDSSEQLSYMCWFSITGFFDLLMYPYHQVLL